MNSFLADVTSFVPAREAATAALCYFTALSAAITLLRSGLLPRQIGTSAPHHHTIYTTTPSCPIVDCSSPLRSAPHRKEHSPMTSQLRRRPAHEARGLTRSAEQLKASKSSALRDSKTQRRVSFLIYHYHYESYGRLRRAQSTRQCEASLGCPATTLSPPSHSLVPPSPSNALNSESLAARDTNVADCA